MVLGEARRGGEDAWPWAVTRLRSRTSRPQGSSANGQVKREVSPEAAEQHGKADKG